MFAAWYFFALLLTVPVEHILSWILTSYWGEWINGLERHGYILEVNTYISVPTGLLSFELNALSYSYGLPLLWALIFASPSQIETKFIQAILGWALVLLPIQVLGLSILSLKTLVFHTTPLLLQTLASAPWQQESLALLYQFTTLILPSVSPILIWLLLYRDFVADILPQAAISSR